MRRVDQVLGGEVFRVDDLACAAAASTIKLYKADVERTPWHNLPLSTQLAFKIAFVSVCHEFNWDFMQNTLAEHLLVGDGVDLVDGVLHIDARALTNWLADYHKPERIRASERAAFLRNVAQKLCENYDGDAAKLLEESNSYIAGKDGFIARLDIFDAYGKDPLRKKSNVLIHDLVRENIVRFNDEENIAPAIDYHIMRLYLRTGRVVPTTIEVVEELKGRPRPRSRMVSLLRKAVSEALRQTAFFSRLTVPDVNYIEWQLGRAICTKDCPGCQPECCSAEIADDVRRLYSGLCPYLDFCEAYANEEWRALREPDYKTLSIE